jgi:chorismate lyase/3-hydroxybenzoate synthase
MLRRPRPGAPLDPRWAAGPQAPYTISYAPEGTLRAACDAHLLALIRFGADDVPTDDPRIVRAMLAPLGAEPRLEVWRSPTPVRSGRHGGIGYAENDEVLFVHLSVETRHALADVTYEAYRSALRFAAARGYPHVLRMWNVVPDLNQGAGDAERYRQFCVGRGRAFDEALPAGMAMPAATCVGTEAGRLLTYFIAARSAAIAMENPRQLSAFSYPRNHGPRSPSFSRATLTRWSATSHLHVSGTASIVGHETRHEEDPGRQLSETIANLESLTAASAARLEAVATPLLLRVYLRRAEDLERARAVLDAGIGAGVPTIFVRADICRRALLLEIEGLWSITPSRERGG